MVFLRNVVRAPWRSLLTALGVAVGLAVYVAINAITLDLRQQIDSAAGAYSLEVIVYERRATSPVSSRISASQMGDLQARFGALVSPMVMGTLNEKWNPYLFVMGVEQDFLRRIPLTSGMAYVNGTGEAMMGEIAASKLGIEPGQIIRVDGREIRISGIFRSGSRLIDGAIVTDVAAAQRMLSRDGAEHQFTLGLLRGVKPDQVTARIAEINRLYPALKAIAGTEFAGALRLMRVVDAFVNTISIVALIGTWLVMVNTLMMAITERTREIGILMTVGWSPWLVLRMLLAESILLSTAGAVLGNFFALGLLRVLNSLESVGFGWIPIRFPLSLAADSVAMAISVAVVSLAWPTAVLYRMQPLTALRHE